MTNRCAWYDLSREQREREIEREEGLRGTRSYEEVGCYDMCDGHDAFCDFYMSEIELEEITK